MTDEQARRVRQRLCKERNDPRIEPLWTPREEQILIMRLGYKQDRKWTLEELGRFFAVSPGRIGQITKRAVAKLEGRKWIGPGWRHERSRY